MAEKETRPRKLTEKGLEYSLEMKSKNLTSLYKQLTKGHEEIKASMIEGEDSKAKIESLRKHYSSWLALYDKFFLEREGYSKLLEGSGKLKFLEDCQAEDEVLLELKACVERYFVKHGSVQRSGSDRSAVSSIHGSDRSQGSIASSIASAKLEEKQKEAELIAMATALEEKQKLDMEKMKIKMKEEELELKTKIEISKAMSKVLDNFEATLPLKKNEGIDKVAVNKLVNKEKCEVEGTASLESVVKHLRKPVADITKFSGNPLDYPKFVRQFKAKVAANCEDEDEKMSYLEQFTVGEAHRVVTGFSYLSAKVGYRAAWAELDERYGNDDALASALVKRALSWPNIKPDNPKALDEFGIFLSECENAVKSVLSAQVLEYPDNLRKLVMKLPAYHHERWRNIMLQIKENGHKVKLKDLVSFVKREARKATDPMYGKEAIRAHDSQRFQVSSRMSKPKGSYSTQTMGNKPTNNTRDQYLKSSCTKFDNKAKQPCLYCGKISHQLDFCNELSAKPHSERLAFIRSQGLCFRCLAQGHMSKDCQVQVRCNTCNRNHQTILHMNPDTNRKMLSACTEVDETDSVVMEAGEGESTLAIIPVVVSLKNGVKTCTTYAFLDPGSTVSFCSDSLAKQLGCSGRRQKITIDTIGSTHTSEVTAINGLQVHDLDCSDVVSLPTVYSKDKLPVMKRHIPTTDDIANWPHLADLHLKEIDSDVGLLIGCNVPDDCTLFEARTGPSGSPHATRTRLGWTLWNVMRPGIREKIHHPVMRTEVLACEALEERNQLDKMMIQSMNFDFPEKAIDDKKEMSQEDKRFIEKVTESIYLQDGHYNISLPFRNENPQMPDNQGQALKRLQGLKKRFEKNEQFHEDYKNFMDAIISKGYAEEVPTKEINDSPGRTWYIPHHGVYHPRKPGKIRVVFDCTASVQGVSLNSSLLQGPDLTTSLLGILMRFREEPIAVMADIESMYYQVRVPKKDCDFLRFMWWPDGNFEEPPKVFRMLVHIFGAVSSASCASFALQQTARDNKNSYEGKITDMITNNFFVDDCLASEDSEAEMVKAVHEVTNLCSEGGFRLTKWISNSHQVMKSIPVDEREKNVRDLDLDFDTLPCERALGIFWSVENDFLSFKITEKHKPNTRRGILSVIGSVYDPLGMASPFILLAKILLQNLCKTYEWDEEIDRSSQKQWNDWQASLPKLPSIQLNRCYKPTEFGTVKKYELHVFSDASELGYGVVIYLRLVNERDDVHCAFVTSKSRVTPLKKVTMPRLELTAATVAVKLCQVTLKALKLNIDNVTYWTDSMSVLRYIHNETSRFQTFVANRITVIRDASHVQQWRYVPTKCNPADCASRGMSLDKLASYSKWFDGPDFLMKEERDWPLQPDNLTVIPESDPEVKKTVNMMKTEDQASTDPIDKLINHYSDWRRLKRAVAWLVLFTQTLKKQTGKSKKIKEQRQTRSTKLKDRQTKDEELHLSLEHLEKAEQLIILHTQKRYFEKEIRILKTNEQKNISVRRIPKSSPLSKLNPFLKNQVLRVGGRLQEAGISYDAKHPVILPKNSTVSNLLLRHTHEQVGHLGRNTILSCLRQKYWILGAGSSIKRLVSKCVTCRRYQARPGEQKMANLPEDRVTSELPQFSHVGMDYFGPFCVKRGRTSVKRYGVLFTCLSIRAIHLEMANSLDTDSCINAIRRFIARRGPPRIIRSDNGTNLVGSRRELKEEFERLDKKKMHNIMLDKGIEWNFNPPAASHHGGVWERMIRSVRKVLFSIMQEQVIRLDDEGLYTLFCEAEGILNNRPITEVSRNVDDLTALTPNNLLFSHGETLPPGVFDKSDTYCHRRWRQVQYLTDLFWRRWVREYLPLLQERQKWRTGRRNLVPGDIVLLMENTPRNAWCLGRVIEANADRRGFVRVAKIKTATSELVRPVDKLCLLMTSEE